MTLIYSKSRFCFDLLLMLLVILATILFWQRADADTLKERFESFDANRDGKVTAEELKQPVLFQRLDTNQDGVILLNEARLAILNGALKAKPEQKPGSAKSDQQGKQQLVRQGPKVLKPGDHGIGRFIPDLSFKDVKDKSWQLNQLARSNKLVVFAMTSTSCPISKKYIPTLQKICKDYHKREVQFILVNPIDSDQKKIMQRTQKEFGNRAIYVHDESEQIALALKAGSTTDVVVINPSRTVVYHGAIDDQYGFGYTITEPREPFLITALDALLAGRTPTVTATDAPGCMLGLEHREVTPTTITYHNRISRLMQQHCIECHRKGGGGPFALETYKEVSSHAGMIKEVIDRSIMPPWFAAETKKKAVNHWANDRSLAAVEKQDLLAWVAGGKPEGNSADAPQPLTFPDGWMIGKPDVIYEMPEAIPIKASGNMPYKYVTVDTELDEDKWVQAIEIQPGQRDVVHHILILQVAPDLKTRINGREGYFAAYVPGNSKQVFPDRYAKLLRKGSRLRFQLHYTPNGRATSDRSRVGLVFAKQPPRHEVHVTGISNTKIAIPANSANHSDFAQIVLPSDVDILSFMPHMHLRGKACRYEIIDSAGSKQTLLDIPRYDFNWQLRYQYATPNRLTTGDTLKFTAWYDNSAENPANPNPNQIVRWGDQTEEEMLIGYVEYVVPGAKPGDSPGMRKQFRQQRLDQIFKRLDKNNDGKLSRQELKAKKLFDRLDANQDDFLTLEEARALNR